MSELKITGTSTGRALPLMPTDLLPAALDTALGTVELREAWEAANEAGSAAFRAERAARNTFVDAHPDHTFASRDDFSHALDTATKTEADAVTAAAKRAASALRLYHRAQREALPSARRDFARAYLEADARAREALAELEAALTEREQIGRFVAQPEPGAVAGRGHWSRSTALVNGGARADAHALSALRVIVDVAPRDLVAAELAA